jgi:ABC-type glycerol-3-phosphate transport system substrate-binding protein
MLLTISALSYVLSANAQTSTLATTAAATTPAAASNLTCDSSETILQGTCDPSLCDEYCNLYGSTYLSDKCCIHDGVNANLLAFEESATWIPRIDEFKKCTGANVKLQYVPGGEDNMAQALIDDVGLNNREDSGQGIYDAYIVQAPWLPPVYEGLKSLSEYIKENEQYIQFMDINQASRSAVSFDGEVRALPLDADYIAMGWRQDVFNKHASEYLEKYGEELKVPTTIDELVDVSEKLNGFDHNGDGEPDWGFCLTPQTNYFNAFVAPVFQTKLREKCTATACDNGAYTGQNIFFDVDTFEPLIFNVSTSE